MKNPNVSIVLLVWRKQVGYNVQCHGRRDVLFIGQPDRWKNDTASAIIQGCIIECPKVIYNRQRGKYVMCFYYSQSEMDCEKSVNPLY